MKKIGGASSARMEKRPQLRLEPRSSSFFFNIYTYIYIERKKGVRMNMNGKIPEGQVYVPRLEPTAPIRLADRNHAHYIYIYIYIYMLMMVSKYVFLL